MPGTSLAEGACVRPGTARRCVLNAPAPWCRCDSSKRETQTLLVWCFFPGLVEAHFYVRALFQINGIDEADLAVVEREDHRLGANAFAEKAHATQ
jgi:hypothetical protein